MDGCSGDASKGKVTYLNLQPISVVSHDEGGNNVPQDKVALLPEVETNTLEACLWSAWCPYK